MFYVGHNQPKSKTSVASILDKMEYHVSVDFVCNNNSVYYDSYTFCYSTLGIPLLYMETVPPGCNPRRGVPKQTTLIGATPTPTNFYSFNLRDINHEHQIYFDRTIHTNVDKQTKQTREHTGNQQQTNKPTNQQSNTPKIQQTTSHKLVAF